MRSRLSMDRDSGKRISLFLLALAVVCCIGEIPKPRAESNSLSLSSPTSSDLLRVGNFSSPAGAIYTWNASVSTDWTNPLNWSPTRALPAASDILVFGAGTPSPIVTNVAGAVAGVNETIAELHVASGVSPTFSTGGANTLTINAGLGVTGFDVSSLAISGGNALRIELALGTVGSVTGFMSVAGGGHRLISNDPNGITFQNSSIFTTSTGFTGSAFGDGSAGNGAAGSILFATGSAYFHNAGGSPFGASGGASVVSFQTGSEADYLTATGFDASGRTYANLIIGNASTAVNASASGTGDFQFDNLTINAAGSNNSSLTFSGSGTNAITIQGSITSNGAGTGTLPDVTLTPGSGGIGINKQGGGTITFGNDLSNSRSIDFEGNASVDANSGLTLSRILQLGFVNPNNKTLTVSGTLSGGAAAYVIGSVLKTFSNSVTSNIFEVGTPNGYSPVDVSGTSGTGSLTINANQSQQPNISGNALKRYWKIASSGGITSADLTFHYLAGDVVGTESNYKIFKYNGSFTQFNPNTLNTTSHFATLNSVTSFSDWTLAEPPPTAASSSVSGQIVDTNGNPVEGAVVRLSGTQNRKTITDTRGNYSFAEVETNGFYTVRPSRVNYNFAPVTRGFSALGAETEASFAATANGNHQNPLDTTEYFVRQQYVDFLNREPEEKGFNDWTDTINNCAPGDTSCDRVHVSEMFFRSEEFQQRGYFVYRFYSTAFGQKPDYAAFAPDLARVSGFLDATQLEAAKMQFAIDFTSRAAFVNQYGTLSNSAYVDALAQTAGVNLSNRQALVNSLEAGTLTRAQALRQITESGEVYQRYYNQAFVVMEYFGYLRRDPDILYLNWLDVLNANPADSRRMVEGFVDATEYRNRFAP
jgi:Carboxypeptidase regulatory-like domain/Domain of unknown function (DUF4214)